MNAELESLFNTRRSRRTNPDFCMRIAEALANDLEHERAVEEGDEIEQFADEQYDDLDYFPNENDASDIENNLVIEPNESCDSEDDEEELPSQTVQQHSAEEYFYGKDGTKWNKQEPNVCIRLRQHNVMRFRAGPKEQSSIPIEVFKRFFTPNIVFVIITETNRYGKNEMEKWNKSNADKKPKIWKDLTETELDAFIGILLAGGVSHNNTQKAEVLWRSDNLPIFRAAMSYHRFIALTRYIRFDDGRTRERRLRDDKAAPIRDIWNFLNENLSKNYSPHDTITIDEQLFPYRGKTKFTQYIPSKPAKYGIKIWWACDSKTKYPLQGKLYTGRQQGQEREVNQGENVMLQLSKPYSNSGRTIVADNFFTTLEGVKRLTKLGLAFVGTIRSNKVCIPKEMKKQSSRPNLSSLFGFHEDLISICSYVPKKNKCANLLSTVHYSKRHFEAILFYNKNKCGVDCMDQMVSHFTTKRSTKRWTFAFFCNMLDIMALAAYCICKEVDGMERNDARREFLCKLSNKLVFSNIEKRMNNIHILKQFSTRSAIESFLGRPINVSFSYAQLLINLLSFIYLFF